MVFDIKCRHNRVKVQAQGRLFLVLWIPIRFIPLFRSSFVELEDVIEVAKLIWPLHIPIRSHVGPAIINDKLKFVAEFDFNFSHKYVTLHLLARYFAAPCSFTINLTELSKKLDFGYMPEFERTRLQIELGAVNLALLGKKT